MNNDQEIRRIKNELGLNAKGNYGTVEQRLDDIETGEISGTSPVSHAALTNLAWSLAGHTIDTDVDFDNNQAQNLVIHNLTEAQIMALASPLTGHIYVASDTGNLWYYTPATAGTAAAENVTRGLAYYIDGTLAVETYAAAYVMPMAMTMVSVRVAVETAPTGADLIIDINKNGTTIFTTQGNRPTIPAGSTSVTSVAPDVTGVVAGDVLSLDIDQIGSTVAGVNLSVTIEATN